MGQGQQRGIIGGHVGRGGSWAWSWPPSHSQWLAHLSYLPFLSSDLPASVALVRPPLPVSKAHL